MTTARSAKAHASGRGLPDRKKRKGAGMAATSAGNSRGESASTDSVCSKPTRPLTIPLRDELSGIEDLALGLRMEMLSLSDGKPVKELGAVLTGTGLGSDFIILKWRDRVALVRGSELLKTWVATFAPEDAARLP